MGFFRDHACFVVFAAIGFVALIGLAFVAPRYFPSEKNFDFTLCPGAQYAYCPKNIVETEMKITPAIAVESFEVYTFDNATNPIEFTKPLFNLKYEDTVKVAMKELFVFGVSLENGTSTSVKFTTGINDYENSGTMYIFHGHEDVEKAKRGEPFNYAFLDVRAPYKTTFKPIETGNYYFGFIPNVDSEVTYQIELDMEYADVSEMEPVKPKEDGSFAVPLEMETGCVVFRYLSEEHDECFVANVHVVQNIVLFWIADAALVAIDIMFIAFLWFVLPCCCGRKKASDESTGLING